MLVLSRKIGEEIVIGEPGPNQIVIKLIKHTKARAVIGIQAPKATAIVRSKSLSNRSAGGTFAE